MMLDQEPIIRIGVFLSVLVVMALAEFAMPRRRREIPRLVRWSNNLALVALDTALVRLVFPVAAVGVALKADAMGWGLLNVLNVPTAIALVLAFLALDLAIYGQHILFHRVPWLWRLHRMHHADLDFDVTTGLRFHPLEILISMAIKMAVVVVLGTPALAVLVFEIVLNASSVFNHANLRLKRGVDAVLRLVLVTPDMHRVHHSVLPQETHSNFGFNLPWWDRIFGTYRAQPKLGHTDMQIGLPKFRNRRELWLDRLLSQPFRGED